MQSTPWPVWLISSYQQVAFITSLIFLFWVINIFPYQLTAQSQRWKQGWNLCPSWELGVVQGAGNLSCSWEQRRARIAAANAFALLGTSAFRSLCVPMAQKVSLVLWPHLSRPQSRCWMLLLTLSFGLKDAKMLSIKRVGAFSWLSLPVQQVENNVWEMICRTDGLKHPVLVVLVWGWLFYSCPRFSEQILMKDLVFICW